MTRSEFVAEIDRLALCVQEAAGEERAEVNRDQNGGAPWRAIDLARDQDLTALGRVRRLARELMGEGKPDAE